MVPLGGWFVRIDNLLMEQNGNPRQCINACPACCNETVAEIHAASDARVRGRALTLSSAVILIYVFVHVWGFISGDTKVLVIPEFVWAVILMPWIGVAGGKIAGIVQRNVESIEEKKQ